MTQLKVSNEENEPLLPGLNTPLEPGEPSFTLRGRDSLAPYFVKLYAAIRSGDMSAIVKSYANLIIGPAVKYAKEPDHGKTNSAYMKAREMEFWRTENNCK